MTGCPSTEILQAFLVGSILEAELAAVEQHVGVCGPCQEQLARLSDDPIASRWHHLFDASRNKQDINDEFLRQLASLTVDGNAASSQLPVVPGYTVLEEIGRGGMGVVYRARHDRLNRLVALKMIPPGRQSGEEEESRFRREAETLARLSHPNIVQVYDVGIAAGCNYLAMELVSGSTLARVTRGKPLPTQLAASIIEVLARATAYAHAQGIIHRDLKPANVLISGSAMEKGDAEAAMATLPDLKLVDFGISKRTDEEQGLTRTGFYLGTPNYMAPEQTKGGGLVTAAVDIHALGSILYELLTGRPPFLGENTVETLLQVAHDDPIPPSRLRARLPRDLEVICLKCLRKDPASRYLTSNELADDLARFLAGKPIEARPMGALERTWRWARKHPVFAFSSATAVLALLTSLVLALVFVVREHQHANDLADALHRAEEAHQKVRYQLAESFLDRALNLADAGEPASGLLWLIRSLETAPAEAIDLQKVIRTNLAAWGRQTSQLRAVLEHPGPISHSSFSPDGSRVLTVTIDGNARLWQFATGSTVAEFHHTGPTNPVFSPDGASILTMQAGRACLVRITAPGCPSLPIPHPAPVLATAFSPDGKWIVTAGEDRTARLWNSLTLEAVASPWTHPTRISAVAFSPHGRAIMIRGEKLAQVVTGGVLARKDTLSPPADYHFSILDHQATIETAVFSPDDQLLVTAGADGIIRWWPIGGEKPVTELANDEPRAGSGPAHFVAFSPDGSRLLTGCGYPWTCRLWNVGNRRPFPDPLPHPLGVYAAAFSADGEFFVTGGKDYTTRIWGTAKGEPRGQPFLHLLSVHSLAVSPDSRTILTGGNDGTAWLLDAESGMSLGALIRGGEVQHLAFSPNGGACLVQGQDNTVRIWQLTKEQASRSSGPTIPHRLKVVAAALSPAGDRLVSASSGLAGEHEICLWNANTGERINPPLEGAFDVAQCVFSADGRYIAAGGIGGGRGIARVWDSATGRPYGHPLLRPHAVTSVAFGPDRETVLAGTEDRVLFWHPAQDEVADRCLMHGRMVGLVAISPDGRRALTAGRDYRGRLWDTDSATHIGTPLPHLDDFNAATFSTSGRSLATASDDGTARLWDPDSGRPLSPPLFHRAGVQTIAFSADGRTVLAGTGDGSVALWDAVTAKRLGPLSPRYGPVTAMAFMPDGRTVLIACRNRMRTKIALRTWPIPVSIAGDREQLALWTQVITGMELDASDAIRTLDPATWTQRRQRLEQLGGPK